MQKNHVDCNSNQQQRTYRCIERIEFERKYLDLILDDPLKNHRDHQRLNRRNKRNFEPCTISKLDLQMNSPSVPIMNYYSSITAVSLIQCLTLHFFHSFHSSDETWWKAELNGKTGKRFSLSFSSILSFDFLYSGVVPSNYVELIV